jgi:hypothetical protein
MNKKDHHPTCPLMPRPPRLAWLAGKLAVAGEFTIWVKPVFRECCLNLLQLDRFKNLIHFHAKFRNEQTGNSPQQILYASPR